MKTENIIDKVKQLLAAASELPEEDRVKIYNQVSKSNHSMVGYNHPVLSVQLVKIEKVEGNDYNPNKVAPPEMKLLKLSIRKDGFTMPVVAARSKSEDKLTVVDGFHRTSVAAGCPDVAKSLGGHIPIVELNKEVEDRITSTVRHNIARGTHQVELSARLVTLLKKHNWTNVRIGEELGMEADEVLRLKQVTGLAEAFKDRDFSQAWS